MFGRRLAEGGERAGSVGVAALGCAVSALFCWWAWKQGAYFGSVFYPGAICVALLLILLAVAAPFPGRLRGPSLVALAAIVGLASWTAISVLWSDRPAVAPEYAARVFVYAALFLIGIWVVLLLGRRMTLALMPVAVAGALIAVATTVVLATGTDTAWYLHDDATLRFPIGYRNANATLLLICVWPLLALAHENQRHWALRSAALAAATALLELAFLAQSRGSVPAFILALTLFIVLSPQPLRAAALLGLAVIPAALAIPALLEVFRHGDFDPAVVPLLRDSARAIALTSALSFALAAFALVAIHPRLRLGAERVKWISRMGAVAVLVVAFVGAGAFVARHGGPSEFVEERISEFTSIGYPDLSEQGVRYGANVGSNRGDFWRVSWESWQRDPILGRGAGSFAPFYLLERRSHETPQDPHSVEFLMLSELGLPGLALLLCFLAAAAVAALRSRRLGARAALLTAAALAATVQWLISASYDWLWQYPGVTASAMFLIGAATAPLILDPGAPWRWRWRSIIVGICLITAVVAVVLGLAERYLDRGLERRESDPAGAIADFDRAAKLARLDPDPLVQQALVALEAEKPTLANKALKRAIDREPTSYAAWLLRARLELEARDPNGVQSLRKAAALNPKAPELEQLRELARLQVR